MLVNRNHVSHSFPSFCHFPFLNVISFSIHGVNALPFELQFVLLSLKKHIRELKMIASRYLGYPWLVCLCYDNHPILRLIFSDFCNYVCFVSTRRWWMYVSPLSCLWAFLGGFLGMLLTFLILIIKASLVHKIHA